MTVLDNYISLSANINCSVTGEVKCRYTVLYIGKKKNNKDDVKYKNIKSKQLHEGQHSTQTR